jgi:hypothetical protein
MAKVKRTFSVDQEVADKFKELAQAMHIKESQLFSIVVVQMYSGAQVVQVEVERAAAAGEK